MGEQHDRLYKVVLVGDPGVGKTNLLGYFTADDQSVDDDGTARAFSSTRRPTVGVEFATKIVRHEDGTVIKAQIWDTAGQERYKAITSSHYRRAAGALLVYDVTDPSTLEHARDTWFEELKKKAEEGSSLVPCTVLVGNKVDMEGKVAVSDAEHAACVQAMGGAENFRTSAKTGEGVVAAFEALIKRVHEANRSSFSGSPALQLKLRAAQAQRDAKSCC